MATHTEPTASTWTDAMKLAEVVTLDEAVRRLRADDNPKIYQYRKPAKIAMGLKVHTKPLNRKLWFVGFDYCDRAGYTQIGTADFRTWASGRGHRPTVFQSDRFGYFHVGLDELNAPAPVEETDLVGVDGTDIEIDRRSPFARRVTKRACELLFEEINGGPRSVVEEIMGLTVYLTPDRADVDAASFLPSKLSGRHGWIRFHFTAPTKISFIEFEPRLAPGHYHPEHVAKGDIVVLNPAGDSDRVVKVERSPGRSYPWKFTLANGATLRTVDGMNGGLIEVGS